MEQVFPPAIEDDISCSCVANSNRAVSRAALKTAIVLPKSYSEAAKLITNPALPESSFPFQGLQRIAPIAESITVACDEQLPDLKVQFSLILNNMTLLYGLQLRLHVLDFTYHS